MRIGALLGLFGGGYEVFLFDCLHRWLDGPESDLKRVD